MLNELIEKCEELTATQGYYKIMKNEHVCNCESVAMYYSWDDEIKNKISKLQWCKPIYTLLIYNGCTYEFFANSYEDLLKQLKEAL